MMNLIKIIKKIFFLCFFCINVLNAAYISIRLLDKHKNILEQAQVKRSFILEIKISDIIGSISDPKIINIDNFSFQKTGYQMHSINGSSTITYQYRCVFDKIGKYTIGPVKVEDDSQSYFSNVISIVVAKKEKLNNTKNLSKKAKRTFLQMHLDKNTAFVGEKVQCFMTFYTTNPSVSVYDIFLPKIKNYTFHNKKGPKQGQKSINGIDYYYVQWSCDLFINQPGEYEIPKSAVDISDDRHDDFFANFSSFFNVRGPKRRLLSNEVTLKIKSLPSFNKKYDGVGFFYDFKVTADKLHIKESDAVIVTVSVKGQGNFNDSLLELKKVPDSFKVHRSKNSIEDHDKEFQIKKSEFILQAMKSGEFILPEQEFVFFNVKKNKYEILKSDPIKFVISSRKKEVINDKKVEKEKQIIEVDSNFKNKSQIDLSPLNENGMWSAMYERMIPWWIFFALLLMPLAIVLYSYMKNKIREYLFGNNFKQKWKSCFKKAKKDILRAQRNNNLSALYSIFIELFSIRCDIKVQDITMEVLSKVLVSSGMKKNKLNQWEQFLSLLAGLKYYDKTTKIDKHELFITALQWVDELESFL